MTRGRALLVVAAVSAGALLALSAPGVAQPVGGRAPAPLSVRAPAGAARPLAAAAPSPPSSPTQITLPAGPGTGAPTVAAPTRLSARAKAAAVLGGLLLIGVLWAFSQGYGILGGRPRRRRQSGTQASDRL